MAHTDHEPATTDYGRELRASGGPDVPLEPGTVVAERYRIGEVLGRGGMGAVYAAEHVTVGRRVALKVLASRWCDSDDVVRRFRDEARAASAAGHPNIVEVFDAGDLPDGRPYIVMEHLEGRELADVIHQQGRLSVERACAIVRDVARALDAAHARGVIHRDLKGENVMLVTRGGDEIVKVVDFGIAANNALGPRLTTPGLVIGTASTMAPEQVEGKPPTIAFDVYALGVLLHDALTGSVPFDHLEGMGMLAAKTMQAAPSIATVRDDLPVALVELVDSCLALDPALRPSTAHEVADRLLEIQQGLRAHHRSLPVVIPPSPGRAARPWRGRAPALAAAAAVVVLVLGVGALSLREAPSASAHVPAPEAAPAPHDPPPLQVDPPVAPPAEGAHAAPPAVIPAPADALEGPPGSAKDEPMVPNDPPVVSDDPPVVADDPPAVAEAPPVDDAAKGVDPESMLCARTRKQAQQAREGHDWDGVLRHTRGAGCWAQHVDLRRHLRAKAYMELEQWDACMSASRALRDGEGKRWHEICRRRREQG